SKSKPVAVGKPTVGVVKKSVPPAVTPSGVKRAAESSSDSDSSDDDAVPVVSKSKPVAVGKPTVGVVKKSVPPAVTPSGVKRAAESSSDSDSSDDDAVPVVFPAYANSYVLSTRGKRLRVGNSSCMHSAEGVPLNSSGVGRKSCPSAFSHTEQSVGETTNGQSFRRNSTPFRRVSDDMVSLHPRLSDNSFHAKPHSQGTWGERANRDFMYTSGKSFKHEKTKKKRGTYQGGSLSTEACSFKFED
ncbi:hypothetical protein EG68_08527, partial [Paragonimus skrjabini miyazakii]